MTPQDFDAAFDTLTRSAYRLEALPAYLVPGEDALRQAIAEGHPRPERSIRTNRWLARIALTTLASGVTWARTRVVDDPLTDYQRQQLEVAYLESQAAGEEIRIARRGDLPADPGGDFWLLDASTRDARAIVMHYDSEGRWTGADLVTDPVVLGELVARRSWIDEHAVPLNTFLAGVHSG